MCSSGGLAVDLGVIPPADCWSMRLHMRMQEALPVFVLFPKCATQELKHMEDVVPNITLMLSCWGDCRESSALSH